MKIILLLEIIIICKLEIEHICIFWKSMLPSVFVKWSDFYILVLQKPMKM